jgi:hypothetical protein
MAEVKIVPIIVRIDERPEETKAFLKELYMNSPIALFRLLNPSIGGELICLPEGSSILPSQGSDVDDHIL